MFHCRQGVCFHISNGHVREEKNVHSDVHIDHIRKSWWHPANSRGLCTPLGFAMVCRIDSKPTRTERVLPAPGKNQRAQRFLSLAASGANLPHAPLNERQRQHRAPTPETRTGRKKPDTQRWRALLHVFRCLCGGNPHSGTMFSKYAHETPCKDLLHRPTPVLTHMKTSFCFSDSRLMRQLKSRRRTDKEARGADQPRQLVTLVMRPPLQPQTGP